MRYRVLTAASVLIFAASVYYFSIKLTAMLDIGTCASGGPYVVAQPCPEGTEADFWVLTASIFGLFIAAGVGALRGPRPGGGGFGFGSMMVAGWALFFTITGAVSLVHSLTSDVIGPDGKTGGIIVGITFLVMGIPALLIGVPVSIKTARETARGRRGGSTVYAGNAPGGEGWIATMRSGSKLMKDLSTQINSSGSVGSDDSVGSTGSSSWNTVEDLPGDGGSGEEMLSRLERLQKLREAGALTDSEFEAQKSRILSS